MSNTDDPGRSPKEGARSQEQAPHSRRSAFSDALVRGGIGYAAIAFIFTIVAFWHNPELVAIAFFVGFASLGLGCVVGFLFGIPKLADDSGTSLVGDRAEKVASTKLLFNTNLGQISDWFTKIVVGLGIAQFGRVLDGATRLAAKFGDVFGESPLSSAAASAYGLSLVIGGLSISFLLMYMWTATRLPEVWS